MCARLEHGLPHLEVRPAGGPSVFFFSGAATTELYTLSLHDALPISTPPLRPMKVIDLATHTSGLTYGFMMRTAVDAVGQRSEEHTSELQSRRDLVCRLLLEKKK